MTNLKRAFFSAIVITLGSLVFVWSFAQQIRAETTADEEIFLPVIFNDYDSSITSTPTEDAPSTATATAISSNTSTPTSTSTSIPSNTSTPTPTNTATSTPSNTSTPTATSTATSIPNTSTPTSVAPTSTPTSVPPTSTPTSIPPTATPTDEPPESRYLSEWILNESGELSPLRYSDDVTQVEVNVLSAEITTVNDSEYVFVYSTGIPNYSIIATDEDISNIENHPNAATNISPSGITVSTGDTITFGMSLGYKVVSEDCPSGEGGGFSPMTGVTCRNDSDHEFYIPTDPQPDPGTCGAGLQGVGYWVNGVIMTSWSDANSYNNEDVWDQVAPVYREYGLDICLGHFTSNDSTYHHHNYSRCLQEQLGDDGSGHSPIYGFVADGYPIYGPWQNDGVLAQSCWMTRTYTADSPTGCGTDYDRSCILNDEYDVSQGISSTLPYTAPSTIDIISYPGSGNSYAAESGLYYQDYYYDSSCTDQGTRYLDQYNGHDHGAYGYHYHATVTDNGDGTYSPSFPYTVGPTYYGDLPTRASNGGVGFAICKNTSSRTQTEPAADLGILIAPFIDQPDKQEELTFPLSLDALYNAPEEEAHHDN